MTSTSTLRRRINQPPILLVPGAANALAARIIEDSGFEAVYVTGAGLANTFLGVPDIGLVTLTELVAHVAAIRQAVSVPLIVDADTGFGNAVGVQRTVRELERAGADGIQLEDQAFPKRCGHFEGKQLVGVSEMVQKIHAAVDARRDPDLVLIARTDARSVEGLAGAVDRAKAYRAAGADVVFIEAPQDEDEVRALPGLVDAPQVINLVEGGKTPFLPMSELQGFRIALCANYALQASIKGMQDALAVLHRTQSISAGLDYLAPWSERQRLVAKHEFDAAEIRYASDAPVQVPSLSDHHGGSKHGRHG
jgi:2-methylisocitrate lyase-like PEP mutase family enzyme